MQHFKGLIDLCHACKIKKKKERIIIIFKSWFPEAASNNHMQSVEGQVNG